MSKTALSKLPKEILTLIFSFLDSGSTLTECQKTCKSWSILAQQLLYSDVVLKSQTKTTLFARTLNTPGSQQGQLVKFITISLPELDHLSIDLTSIVYCLGENSPFLEAIDTTLTEKKEFWIHLMQIFYRQKWKYIKHISVPIKRTVVCYQYYVTVMLLFHSTIISLVLDTNFANKIIRQEERSRLGHYNLLRQNLDLFPNLRILRIFTDTNASLFEYEENVLEKCGQALKDLNITQSTATDRLVSTNSVDDILSTTKPFANLKSLKISNVPMNNISFLYLMYKFPYLDSLELSSEHTFQEYLSFTMPTDILKKLAMYLLRIKNFSFDGVYLSYVPGLAKVLMESQKKSIALANSVAIKYYADKQDIQETRITAANTFCESEDSTTKVVSSNIKYNIFIKASAENSPKLCLPHTSFLMGCGHYLTELVIDFNTAISPHHYLPLNQISTGHNLDCIFVNCPKLKVLEIAGVILAFFSPGFSQRNTSIEKLLFRVCRISFEIFPQLSMRLASLNHLSLLDSCSFIEHYNEPKRRSFVMIDMPYSSLCSLFMDLILSLGTSISFSKVYLKLSSVNGEYYRSASSSVSNESMKNCKKEEYLASYSNPRSSVCLEIRCREFAEEFKLNAFPKRCAREA